MYHCLFMVMISKHCSLVLMFVTVRSNNLTVRGHSLVRVSIWYSFLWSVVLLSCFWCFNEIFDADGKNLGNFWKFKIKLLVDWWNEYQENTASISFQFHSTKLSWESSLALLFNYAELYNERFTKKATATSAFTADHLKEKSLKH